MKKILILILLIVSISICGQSNPPKQEIRGAWIATVSNIDWPSNVGTSSTIIQQQKQQIIFYLDELKATGINTIYFQVRTTCDALYKSAYEPWSAYLTGSQGTPPSDPNYDPLKFAIEEAHKRGMELHAWVNPYRALLSNGNVGNLSPQHIINTHPEWIIKCDGTQYRFLNPGLPWVRNYVTNVCMDIVKNYDVDGLHMDDYFYPYSSYGTYNDDTTFAAHPNGFSNKSAWRKNNVNMLLRQIYDSILVVKPYVKFSISPGGNPMNFGDVYIDPPAWLAGTYTDANGTYHDGDPYIDAIIPQIYWYGYWWNYSMNYWNNATLLNGRDCYVGTAAYRLEETGWPTTALGEQIKDCRSKPLIKGNVYFSAKSITNNIGKCKDTLRNNYYKYEAIPYVMNWKDLLEPNQPENMRYEKISGTNVYGIFWDTPLPALDGDTAARYVVYRFNSSPTNPSELNDATKIIGVQGLNTINPYPADTGSNTRYFVVTALDRNTNESVMSNILILNSPISPNLASPQNLTDDLPDTIICSWNLTNNAGYYQLQISEYSDFSSLAINAIDLLDTSYQVTGLKGQKEYFWKVRAYNPAGYSQYSDVWSFKTGFPVEPELIYPVSISNVSRVPRFVWSTSIDSGSYNIQLAKSSNFNPSSIVFDIAGISDTTFLSTDTLTSSTFYYWRVRSQNKYGFSNWTTYKSFKTGTSTYIKENEYLPKEYTLFQNYPNPFNPTTTIKYALPEASNVQLIIYNILGQEVARLVDDFKPAGVYNVTWDAGNLSSGIYLYRIKAGKYSDVKKLILVK